MSVPHRIQRLIDGRQMEPIDPVELSQSENADGSGGA